MTVDGCPVECSCIELAASPCTHTDTDFDDSVRKESLDEPAMVDLELDRDDEINRGPLRDHKQ